MKKLYFLLIIISALSTQGLAHVNLLNPIGNETYDVGETVTLEWQIAISHNIQNWDLFFSEDDGLTWDTIQIDIPSTGNSVGLLMTYEWLVPDIPTSEAIIWIYMDNAATDYDDTSDAFTIVTPVGIEENMNPDSNILLYPNPVQVGGELNLSFQGNEIENSTIQIFDLTGNRIKFYINEKSVGVKKLSFDFIGLKSGMYYLLITDQNGVVRRKKFLIIEN